MAQTLTIATRKSALALWQAEHVKALLEKLHPGLEVQLLGMSTQGDRILDVPLAKIGGKGLFVKELENALYDGRADIAVHSMKDVPMRLPDGLTLGAILERESPFDAFVSPQYERFADLPQGAIVGTSSLRRQCQLLARRPDLDIRSLRGNVNTRLAKLDAGEFDAIILASSGLIRLGFEDRIRHHMDVSDMLPAVGQGALGIECRSDDPQTLALIAPLIDQDTTCCVAAERAFNRHLEGGCQVPIAGFAQLSPAGQGTSTGNNSLLTLEGLVGSLDGSRILQAQISGPVDDAEALGQALGEQLLSQGAGELLQAAHDAGA